MRVVEEERLRLRWLGPKAWPFQPGCDSSRYQEEEEFIRHSCSTLLACNRERERERSRARESERENERARARACEEEEEEEVV